MAEFSIRLTPEASEQWREPVARLVSAHLGRNRDIYHSELQRTMTEALTGLPDGAARESELVERLGNLVNMMVIVAGAYAQETRAAVGDDAPYDSQRVLGIVDSGFEAFAAWRDMRTTESGEIG